MPRRRVSLTAPWRIGVDVGGTFTDLVFADGAGALFTFKAPTNPSNPAAGVMAAVAMAAQGLGLSVEDVLRGCRVFVHGSTIATNTILERKGAVVGLLTTEGFRDSLEIRRGFREDAWDHRSPFPQVLVPRHLRLRFRSGWTKTAVRCARWNRTALLSRARRLPARRRDVDCDLFSQQLSQRQSRARLRGADPRSAGPKSGCRFRRISRPSSANMSAPPRRCSTPM